jgi:hypothetical protein
MEQKQLEKFRVWFDEYVASFYGEDEFLNANLKLKEDHSRRTCEEMLDLAGELGLDANGRRVAEAIALFHDIGRFRQFVEYRTYNDTRSVDHCLLGLDVLRRAAVLKGIERAERELIEKAIEYHGLKELPGGLDGECLLFSQLIRDADKLDVLYTVTEYQKQYRNDPKGFMLELEFADTAEYSAEAVEEVLMERRVDYGKLRTLNDMRLLQLAWVYDVNFPATLERMKERGFLETLLDFMPETGDIERVRKKIFGYVNARIERDKKVN